MRDTSSSLKKHTCAVIFTTPTNMRTNNMNDSSIIQGQIDGEQDDKGFTLIEILIAIVLVGVLSAVAVVGISSLVNKGNSASCGASADSARAASAVYFATNSSYPTTFTQMTGTGALSLPSTVTVNAAIVPAPTAPATTPPAAAIGMQASGGSWWLNMTAGTATTAPTFACT
jgi:prepilin-type N-terminal cleavage/methylation domain-containing protein